MEATQNRLPKSWGVRTPFSASSILPSLRFGQISLDEAEHFLDNRVADGASLLAVRNHPGMPFAIIPGLEFGSAGIPFQPQRPPVPHYRAYLTKAAGLQVQTVQTIHLRSRCGTWAVGTQRSSLPHGWG
jgi:hypothetical protein